MWSSLRTLDYKCILKSEIKTFISYRNWKYDFGT